MNPTIIIKNIAAFSLILFMSVTSIAKPSANFEGNLVKAGVEKQIEVVNCAILKTASTVSFKNEFIRLRFDVTYFNAEIGVTELPSNSLDYLRFEASNYTNGVTSEITELPLMNEFNYLHFNVNNFNKTSDLTEMPSFEFDYLRFNVNKFANENTGSINELPESR
jgi:hypothetical protein